MYTVDFYLDGVRTSTYQCANKHKIASAISFFYKWLGARFSADIKMISPSGDALK